MQSSSHQTYPPADLKNEFQISSIIIGQSPVKVEPTAVGAVSSSSLSSTSNSLTCCPVCPRHFRIGGNDNYRRHLLHHVYTEEDETACPACPFTNMDPKLVLEHFMMTHGNLDRFYCSHFGCDRKFWVQRDYLRHFKNHDIVVL